MGVAGPQVLTAFGHSLRTPHERVHIAGTESATLWGGYMDGAVQSGERAAHEILVRLHQAKTPGIQVRPYGCAVCTVLWCSANNPVLCPYDRSGSMIVISICFDRALVLGSKPSLRTSM